MLEAYREEPQVMVIDDLPSARATLRDMLLEMGFKDIVEASNGKEALEKLRKHRAQLIICDNIMEGMSGLDLLYQLRNFAYLVDIPFIMVSSCSEVPMIDTARVLGAEDYILKPLSFRSFKRKVLEVLQRRAFGAS